MSAQQAVPLHRHPRPHKELWRRYRYYAARKDFWLPLLLSVILFCTSVVVSFFAIAYATERASNSVPDIILSNIPALDVDGLFVYGTLSLIAFITLLLLAHPKRLPFALDSMALFFFIRSCFVTLTHIGPFPIESPDAGWGTLISHFLFSSDLFFSGHTGVPFLMALIFWREKNLRYIFLAWSVFMAVVVLLGHFHYSIDVASAYFITYSIFCIAQWLFSKERALFYSDVPISVT